MTSGGSLNPLNANLGGRTGRMRRRCFTPTASSINGLGTSPTSSMRGHAQCNSADFDDPPPSQRRPLDFSRPPVVVRDTPQHFRTNATSEDDYAGWRDSYHFHAASFEHHHDHYTHRHEHCCDAAFRATSLWQGGRHRSWSQREELHESQLPQPTDLQRPNDGELRHHWNPDCFRIHGSGVQLQRGPVLDG